MAERHRIGFVGFGVVGRAFSHALAEHGAEIAYFDLLGPGTPVEHAVYRPLPALVAGSDLIISTVVTQAAVPAAHQVAPLLKPGQTYLDFNSTSPAMKVEIAGIIAASGAQFVEGAIISPVGASGSQSVALLSGPTAEATASLLCALGLPKVKYLSPQYGDASMVKMLRSIFSKGVDCLLVEMLAAGRRAGIDDYLWRDVMAFMANSDFQKLAENWVTSHVTACERRWHEMEQVVETLEGLDVEPVMARAIEVFYGRSAGLAPGEAFADTELTVDSAIGFFADHIGTTPAAP
jgi:3-hydroxyisobutyrate dehydrogenase-like beta-hydroxyacid dehydrogenase